MLSSEAQIKDRVRGLRTGANDYVGKPYDTAHVIARIRQLIGGPPVRDLVLVIDGDAVYRSALSASLGKAGFSTASSSNGIRSAGTVRSDAASELVSNAELAHANRELEAFSYSVSHDLRAPLRTISAFTRVLVDELGERLDERGREHVRRVLAASSRMSDLIDALLELSHISLAPIGRHRVDLSAIARASLDELVRRDPDRHVIAVITPHLQVEADARLMRVLFDNMLGNAWKFTRNQSSPRIEVGVANRGTQAVYFVRDNGAGFEMAHADRLFTPFGRLHAEREYSGTGIGLATVRRIVERHGGAVWAESSGEGAVFAFTIPPGGVSKIDTLTDEYPSQR